MGTDMYKCNIAYRYRFILRWNLRIYFMCGQALAHEQENFNKFPCSGIFLDFRGFWFLVLVSLVNWSVLLGINSALPITLAHSAEFRRGLPRRNLKPSD